MHIVVLTQVLDRRDAVLGFFHRWCEVFAQHAERLTVVAQRVGEVQLPASVAVRSLGRERGAGLPRMALRLWRELLAGRGAARPTAILAHMVPKYVLYAAPIAVPRRLPLYLWYTHAAVDRNLRLAVPLVRKVFTASEESFRLDAAARKRVVTGHGIDCEYFAPPLPGSAARSVDVLSVGRLAPSKGQHEILEAVAGLPGVRVELAGDVLLERDREYRRGLEAAALALGGRARLLGAVAYPAVAEVMRRARIMVNASRTGSVDKVVLEAMACGTPTLTCNESFARVLGPELAARLMFRPGDVPGLRAAMARLLALSDGEHEALGAALRARVLAEHDLQRLVPRLLSEMETAP